MVLELAFRFWPIASIYEAGGWVYGTYAGLSDNADIRTLLEQGRLRGRRKRGNFTDAHVNARRLLHHTVDAALETTKVLRETFEFEFQRYCAPSALVSRERAEEALLRFMELPARDTVKAIEYIREFGDFESNEIDQEGELSIDVPTKIKEFWKTCRASWCSPFVLKLSDFWDVQTNLRELWDLNTSLREKRMEAVRMHCLQRWPNADLPDERPYLTAVKALLRADLSASLNSGRKYDPRLVLHEENGKLALWTMCMDVRTGLHMMLLEKILSGTGYRTCARKDCGKYFIAVKGKKYCSTSCQNKAKVRRFRERHGPIISQARSSQHKNTVRPS